MPGLRGMSDYSDIRGQRTVGIRPRGHRHPPVLPEFNRTVTCCPVIIPAYEEDRPGIIVLDQEYERVVGPEGHRLLRALCTQPEGDMGSRCMLLSLPRPL